MRQQMGKVFVESKGLWSALTVFITLSQPQTSTSKHVGKYSIQKERHPLQTHTKHFLRKSRKLESYVFSTTVRSLESGYLFLPLLLVIFLGKPVESLKIQQSVFSSSCIYSLVTSQLFTHPSCLGWSLQLSYTIPSTQTHLQSYSIEITCEVSNGFNYLLDQFSLLLTMI